MASAEVGSEHPVGEAIVTAARDRGLALQPAIEFAAHPGHGISATIASTSVAVGNQAHMASLAVDTAPLAGEAARAAAAGGTPITSPSTAPWPAWSPSPTPLRLTPPRPSPS